MTDLSTEPRVATTPWPAGRGRWRLQLIPRMFAINAQWSTTILAEITDARSRRLEQVKNGPATLTFVLDGHSPSAALIRELQQDVIAWRWDEYTGRDVCVFRGLITNAQDSLSADKHTLSLTAHDYLAVLQRRILTSPVTYTGIDQDVIATGLLSRANNATASNGTAFSPGSYTPININLAAPDGSTRPASGVYRDRTYTGNSVIWELFSNLAAVQGGFDFAVTPFMNSSSQDGLNLYYPRRGVTRSDIVLAYGSNVSEVTRDISSANYANHIRVLGNNGSEDPAAPQLYSETWNADANNVTAVPVGLWSTPDAAADVSVQATLDQKAAGDLATLGVLVPSYTLKLTPGAYRYGYPNMGDTVPLVIRSGRLNVVSNVDVTSITYAVGDDGDESVELGVGRPAVTFADLFTEMDATVNALARR